MTVWESNTNTSQSLKLRIRPIGAEALPLTCSIKYSSGDSNMSGSVTASSAYYDSNDFLCLSASISIPYGELFGIEVFQVSASDMFYNRLYMGEIMATTASATIKTSEPFDSYSSGSTEYIIF